MKSFLIFTLTLTMVFSCKKTSKDQTEIVINYPETKQVDTVDTYFGVTVKDPYRWLEDDMSDDTVDWVNRQNEVTFGFLDNIPYRQELKERLEKMWNYEKITAPFKQGEYTYFYKNDGLQNQYVVYRKKNNDTSEEVFLDPNTFSEDGTISLGTLQFSKSGKKAAYSISEGGSDWRKILVLDAVTKTVIEDTLVDVKFSRISWYKDEGFYYSSYDKPKGSELSAKTDQHKVYYHKLGTKQAKDQLIFGGTIAEKHRYVFGGVTEDDSYLYISAATTTSGNKLFIKDLNKPNSDLITVLDHTESDTYPINNIDGTLYLVTNLDAPNKKIVSVDASNPTPEHWEDVIPETKHVLSPSTGGGYLFAEYMVDAISKVKQYAYNGTFIRDIELPGVGNAGGFGGRKEDKEDYFTFTNYNTPTSIYK